MELTYIPTYIVGKLLVISHLRIPRVMRRILISEEVLKMLSEGRARYAGDARIKLGRWVLGRKIGDFLGCKSEAEG